MNEWIKREHPNGIDWRKEYERLLGVIEQAIPCVTKSNAVKSLMETALECGNALLKQSYHEEQEG